MKRRINHRESPLARFHEDLAGKKRWNLEQLVSAIQTVAWDAEKAVGETHPQRVGNSYVIAMLYGTRAMPHRWRVATANALEMAPADYTRQRELVLSASIVAPNKSVFPTDYWPHFTWRSEFSAPRKIAARLYGLAKDGLTPSFSVIPGKWQAPAGFSDYLQLRNEGWEELVANYSRMKKEPPNPKSAWHVRKIAGADASSVALEVMQVDYRDILVTATQQGLEHTIQTSIGKRTVRQWLASFWKPGDCSDPVLPSARHLVVNLMVVTKDGSVVLSRQGPDSPDGAGSWATSVSIILNPKTDCDSLELPDLARAASRGCKEELNMESDGKSVRWLTMAAGFKFGTHTFFGLLESPWSRQDIQSAVAQNVERAKRDTTRVCQVVEVEFLEPSARKIAQRLTGHDYRPYLELGLAAVLWRNGDAEFTEGLQPPFSAETSKQNSHPITSRPDASWE